jgi:hypothetical protein
VAVILTSNPRYALRGVRPFTRFAAAARRLHLRHGVRIGRHTFYLTSSGPSRGVVEVRRGVIVAVGIAEKSLTGHRLTARRLLSEIS